jgi:NADPH-dependent glutamate synthase beta subunit-like oxidoreductase
MAIFRIIDHEQKLWGLPGLLWLRLPLSGGPDMRQFAGDKRMNNPFASSQHAPQAPLSADRGLKPSYVKRLPPCNGVCPAGEDTQGWLSFASKGEYETAWRVLTAQNPLPAVMGRVCYHPCEGACNRGKLDEAVGINSVERFLGDEAIKHGWQFELPQQESGKHVLVVGAGPSGLAAAYHLRRLGHRVTIREAGPLAGGMMRFGIPKYRLPREVLEAEVQRILNMGVKLELNTKVERILDAMHEGFDAAFLAVGAHIAKRTSIPAGTSARILDAVSVLRSMEGEEMPMLGRRVVVYGGGNTAIDVARTAKRLGATEAIIVYRRTRDKMPAHDFEVEEALQEGVMMKWLSTIKEVGEGAITVEKVVLDASGKAVPTGEFETLEADSVVLALGQDVDLSLLDDVPGLSIKHGSVEVASNMMTGYPGIFAGGDMVPSERTVTVGVGHGKLAARHIDGWLRSTSYVVPPRAELASFDKLNTWYYSDAPQSVRPMLDVLRRQSTFDEVQGGLDSETALFEARRCMSCGNCFECDCCYEVCPSKAVIKLGPGKKFEFNYEACNNCGLCAGECPCGAIKNELVGA